MDHSGYKSACQICLCHPCTLFLFLPIPNIFFCILFLILNKCANKSIIEENQIESKHLFDRFLGYLGISGSSVTSVCGHSWYALKNVQGEPCQCTVCLMVILIPFSLLLLPLFFPSHSSSLSPPHPLCSSHWAFSSPCLRPQLPFPPLLWCFVFALSY